VKKYIISTCLCLSIAGSTLSASDSVNIDNLIRAVEGLQSDISALNKRVDSISGQSYDARVLAEKDKRAIKVIYKKVSLLEKELGSIKNEKNRSNADVVVGSGAKAKGNLFTKQSYKTIVNLVVRKNRTKRSEKLAVLSKGTRVGAICDADSTKWCYIPSFGGFVYKHYLSPLKNRK